MIQPESMRDETVLRALAAAEADFFVVVAFGHILRENVLKLPRLACINVHASLLPAYRGPAPIQWAVINGERETGVTTMIMEKGLDTGDILMTAREPIGPEDTAGTLHDRLARGVPPCSAAPSRRSPTGPFAAPPRTMPTRPMRLSSKKKTAASIGNAPPPPWNRSCAA